MNSVLKWLLAFVLVVVLAAAGSVAWLRYEFQRVEHSAAFPPLPARALAHGHAPSAPCDQQFPDKRAWFGALHVHTAVSYDATSFGARTSVEQAYRSPLEQ